MQKIQSFHMRCLRQILQVKWQDHVPDTEVLQRSKSMSIGSMLMESQLRWSGHIARMPDYRLPKRVFFGELCSGNRSRGRPRKRYKDTLKVALKRCHIEPSTWEVCAQDRVSWRSLERPPDQLISVNSEQLPSQTYQLEPVWNQQQVMPSP